jgi:hypothetical protein
MRCSTSRPAIFVERYAGPEAKPKWPLATELSCIILTRGGRHRGRRFFYGRWSTKRWQRNRGLPLRQSFQKFLNLSGANAV